MTAIEVGLTLNAIAMMVDKPTFSKISAELDKLEHAYIELMDENKKMNDIIKELKEHNND